MLLWIILSTLVNCVVLFFFTRFFSINFLKKFIIVNFIISLILTIICFIEIGYFNEMSYLYLFNWINIGIMKINIVLLYDTLTIVMVFIVLFISGLVHLYSFSYMRHDPNFFRFIAYLSLFTFFMLVLVTSNNFLQLLIGWEGVGLSSYLLICFWYTRIAANLAAIKAMSVNRIGDIFLLFTIFLIYSFFGSINFGVVFNNVIYLLDFYFDLFFIEIRFIDLVCFFIFLAACGKSAQLLLHIWLPDAMEGPTPVSALIHAATMVTAGVFLVIRCSILFEHSSKILFFMVFLGSLTCFFMSILGAFQQDIKKIVAYSTCSQLGYMFMGCGLSSYNTSFFHLFNHAFFKALLFLSMGVIIHALSDEQDLRKMGNLVNFLPFTIVVVFFGNFALLGLPFLAGFYSKDILIEVAFARFYFDGSFAYILGLLAAFFTAFYSTRLFIRIFFSYSNFNRYTIFNIHEVDILMFIPLLTLLLCSFFVGFFFFDVFIGMGSFFFFDSIFINYLNYSGIYIEFESLINLNNYNFVNNLYFQKFENVIFLNYTSENIDFLRNNNQSLKNNNDILNNFVFNLENSIKFFILNGFDIKNLYLSWNLLFYDYRAGTFIKTLEEKSVYDMFIDTYGDVDAFFNNLTDYQLQKKNSDIDVMALFIESDGDSVWFFDQLNDYKLRSIKRKSYLKLIDEQIYINYIAFADDHSKLIFNNFLIFIRDLHYLELLIYNINSCEKSKNLILYFPLDSVESQFNLYIKILPLVVSILGCTFYYYLDDRFIIYYHNKFYRLIVLKFYNGLFFDKLFIDVLVSKFYFFSYYSFYKNIESSFFQKYNIYIFEKEVFNWFFFFKIFSKGYFFVYILIVLSFIYFYIFLFFIFKFLNYSILYVIVILFIYSFTSKWIILKNYIKKNLVKNLNNKLKKKNNIYNKILKKTYYTNNILNSKNKLVNAFLIRKNNEGFGGGKDPNKNPNNFRNDKSGHYATDLVKKSNVFESVVNTINNLVSNVSIYKDNYFHGCNFSNNVKNANDNLIFNEHWNKVNINPHEVSMLSNLLFSSISPEFKKYMNLINNLYLIPIEYQSEDFMSVVQSQEYILLHELLNYYKKNFNINCLKDNDLLFWIYLQDFLNVHRHGAVYLNSLDGEDFLTLISTSDKIERKVKFRSNDPSNSVQIEIVQQKCIIDGKVSIFYVPKLYYNLNMERKGKALNEEYSFTLTFAEDPILERSLLEVLNEPINNFYTLKNVDVSLLGNKVGETLKIKLRSEEPLRIMLQQSTNILKNSDNLRHQDILDFFGVLATLHPTNGYFSNYIKYNRGLINTESYENYQIRISNDEEQHLMHIGYYLDLFSRNPGLIDTIFLRYTNPEEYNAIYPQNDYKAINASRIEVFDDIRLNEGLMLFISDHDRNIAGILEHYTINEVYEEILKKIEELKEYEEEERIKNIENITDINDGDI